MGVTRIQGVVSRRSSLDEPVGVVTSGHVTKMAVTPFDPPFLKNPMLYANFMTLYLEIRSYCPLKFYIAGIGNFVFFLRKNSANY